MWSHSSAALLRDGTCQHPAEGSVHELSPAAGSFNSFSDIRENTWEKFLLNTQSLGQLQLKVWLCIDAKANLLEGTSPRVTRPCLLLCWRDCLISLKNTPLKKKTLILWACINLSGTFSRKSFLGCVDHTLLIAWRDVNWPSPSPDSHQQSAAQPRWKPPSPSPECPEIGSNWLSC